jgi:hypothetical protein
VEDSKPISAVAWTIRKSIIGSRDYEHARKAAALSCATFGEMASEKTEHRFWQEDGGMTFNSVAKYVCLFSLVGMAWSLTW